MQFSSEKDCDDARSSVAVTAQRVTPEATVYAENETSSTRLAESLVKMLMLRLLVLSGTVVWPTSLSWVFIAAKSKLYFLGG